MLSSNLSSAALGSHPEEVFLHMLGARTVMCNSWDVSCMGFVMYGELFCASVFLSTLVRAGLAGEVQLASCGAYWAALRLGQRGCICQGDAIDKDRK